MADTHVLVYYEFDEGDGHEFDILHSPNCTVTHEIQPHEHFITTWDCLVEFNFDSNGWDCLDGGMSGFHPDDIPPGIYEIVAWEEKWTNSDWNTEWESGVSIIKEIGSDDG